jgi:hypothetical protein
MTTEKPENTSLVASLISQFEAQVATLQAAIASLRAVQAAGSSVGLSSHAVGAAVSASNTAVIDLPEGAFKNKSIPQCIELYLSTVGMKKKTNQEIADALKEGGVESTGDLGNSVTGALFKLKTLGKILRFKDGWGLASNYPAHIRGAAATPTGPPKVTKKKRRRPKSPSTKQAKASVEPKPASTSPVVEKKKGVTEEISRLLASHPGRAFDAEEIAERFGLNKHVADMLAGKLAKAGKAQKTDGRYRWIIPTTGNPQVLRVV